jgi:hypothetical protein
MYVKKLKRKCSVRGCKCTDTFAISLTREVGNTVIICKSCLGKALGAIDDIPLEPELRASHSEAPSLFFNAKMRKAVVLEPVQEEVIEALVQEEAPADEDTATPLEAVEEFVCPHCGQVCKSELGLQKHISAKHKDLV